MVLCSMSGDLEVVTLSKLRLTLTRFVPAGTAKPSVLVLRDSPGLADLEGTALEPCSDTALYPIETELRRD
jgi:hypothetical protein